MSEHRYLSTCTNVSVKTMYPHLKVLGVVLLCEEICVVICSICNIILLHDTAFCLSMSAILARGVITPNQRYVCLSCRLHNSSAEGRTIRYQHTGPSENGGDDTNQEYILKDAEKDREAASRSPIGDIIRSFIFRSGTKDKKIMSDSRIGSLGMNKVHLADLSSLKQSVRPAAGDCG